MTYLDTRDLAEIYRTTDDPDEREAIAALAEQIGSGDPADVLDEASMLLIPEDEFTDYAREFAEEIGAIDRDARWPAYCIDWEAAARDLSMDFTIYTYDGRDYYGRES